MPASLLHLILQPPGPEKPRANTAGRGWGGGAIVPLPIRALLYLPLPANEGALRRPFFRQSISRRPDRQSALLSAHRPISPASRRPHPTRPRPSNSRPHMTPPPRASTPKGRGRGGRCWGCSGLVRPALRRRRRRRRRRIGSASGLSSAAIPRCRAEQCVDRGCRAGRGPETRGLRRLSRSGFLWLRSLEPPLASRRLTLAPCAQAGGGGGAGAGGPWDCGALRFAAAEPRREEDMREMRLRGTRTCQVVKSFLPPSASRRLYLSRV